MTKLCGAKTRAGGTCTQPALPNGRCRYHGGKSLAGPASPTFKTGRYSKVLPARLMARYQEAVSDTEMLALREDIALLDARLHDILGRVDTGESGSLWRQLSEAWHAMEDARARKDTEAMGEALNTVGKLIKRGHSDYAAWHEIRSLLDQRRRLGESERKRLVEMQTVMDVKQAMTFVAAVLDTVQRHVTDRRLLGAIGTDIQSLLAIEGGAVRARVDAALDDTPSG